MSILKDVLSELYKMFVGDAWLTVALLAVVAAAAGIIRATSLPPLVGGAVLLLGCLAVLVIVIWREARNRA